MTPADLRSLAADHAHIRHHPHEVAAALLAAADEIDRKEGELLGADALHEAEKRMHKNTKSECNRMRAAITALVDNLERWLDTGTPAGPEESKAIYEQLCRSVGREPQP